VYQLVRVVKGGLHENDWHLLLSALIGAASAWNEPDGFRGVPWESSEAAFRERIKVWSCSTPSDQRLGERLCIDNFTLGSVPVRGGYYFRADRFVSALLTFSAKDFPAIEGIFLERYGAPTSTTEQALQNRMGAQFENQVHLWLGDRVRIRLAKYGSKVTDGLVTIMLKTEAERFEKGSEEERKKGAGQL
jgi:hypothetical protein